MGDIYLATDSTLDRPVAVKVLSDRYAEDAAIRARFTREALAAARLAGAPSTVTIFDVGEWERHPFIVMEYLPGGSLEDVLRAHGPQAPGRAVAWLEQAGRALDAAHALGIVHRDIKPGNLLLDGNGVVHVADFGIASAAGLDSLTSDGTVLGTAGYLSPEQAAGGRATAASDCYALGVVAFELLTGTRPFARESPTAEASAHVHEPPPSATGIKRDLPRGLDPVLERALAKEPGARYASCADLVAAVASALAGGRDTPARAASTRRSGGRRIRVPIIVAGGVALAGLSVTAALALGSGDDGSRATDAARPRVTTIVETQPTRTVEVTVTATSPPPPPPPQAAPAAGDPAALNDEGFRLMQAGDFQGALPLLEQAVAGLRGTGQLAEAYASYNLAFTRLRLGDCAGVGELLDRSEAVQGRRKEIDRLRKDARKQCR